ncbi:hypothetical protein STSO111631_03680 [Stackebrandtia soli]
MDLRAQRYVLVETKPSYTRMISASASEEVPARRATGYGPVLKEGWGGRVSYLRRRPWVIAWA